MPQLICMRYIISGKVQGVWFRASTQKKAQRLSITGWVRNLPTGQVEVLACGTEDAISQLHDWLQQGPELAQVSSVTSEVGPVQEYQEFLIV